MSAGTPAPQLPTSNVRVVTLRLRTVFIGLGIALGVLAALEFFCGRKRASHSSRSLCSWRSPSTPLWSSSSIVGWVAGWR